MRKSLFARLIEGADSASAAANLAAADSAATAADSAATDSASEAEGVDKLPIAGEGKTFTQEDVDRIVTGRLKKLTAENERLIAERGAKPPEDAVKAAREEAKAEVAAAFTERLFKSDARAIAAELGFHDPSEPLAHLKTDDLIKDGETDAKALRAALEEIAKNRPYLVKDGSPATHKEAGIGRRGDAPESKPGLSRLEEAFNRSYANK